MRYRLKNTKFKYYTLHYYPENIFCCGQSIKTILRLYSKYLENNVDPSNGKPFFKELLIQFTREEIIGAVNGDTIQSEKFMKKIYNIEYFDRFIFFPIHMGIVILDNEDK